jgi:protein-tyrosine phosphatase
MTMKKILFVCAGNTCRSPIAESIMKQRLKEKAITNIRCSSAGIFADIGKSISKGAKESLKKLGIKPVGSKARQADGKVLKRYNLVLCMTAAHKEALEQFGHKNIFTIAEFTKTADVADPFGGGEEQYLAVAKQLIDAVDIILDTF